jgi:hypothetical protein
LSGGSFTGIPRGVRTVIPWPWRWDRYGSVGGSSMRISHPPRLPVALSVGLAADKGSWPRRSDRGRAVCSRPTLPRREPGTSRQRRDFVRATISRNQLPNSTITARKRQGAIVLAIKKAVRRPMPADRGHSPAAAHSAMRAQRNCGASCASIGSSSVSFIAQVITWWCSGT